MNALRKKPGPPGSLGFWLIQNEYKKSLWADLVHAGHQVYHLVQGGWPVHYLGQIEIDGYAYTYEDARKKFECSTVAT